MTTHPKSCWPSWYAEGEECPYGREIAFDVTWNEEVFEKDPFWLSLAIFWSFVPVVVIALGVLEFLWRRGTRELNVLAFSVVVTLLNDSIFKPLLGEKRPAGSCACTCGMPSGHATISMGLLALFFFDGVHRIAPLQVESTFSAMRQACRTVSAMPLAVSRVLSQAEFVFLCSVWVVLLLPVPWSRVVLKDHSNYQVLVGGGLGVLYGCAWFYLIKALEKRFRPEQQDWKFQPGWSPIPLLVYNYYIPSVDELRQQVLQSAERNGMIELSTEVGKEPPPVEGGVLCCSSWEASCSTASPAAAVPR